MSKTKTILLFIIVIFAIPLLMEDITAAAEGQPGTYVYDNLIEIDGFERVFHYYLPSDYDQSEPYPMLILLHGGFSNGDSIRQRLRLDELAEEEGFVLVFPDAYQIHAGIGHWADGRGTTPQEQMGIDDVLFLSSIIDRMEEEYTIDMDKVFIAGVSNGGYLAHLAGIKLSDKINTIVSIISSMSETLAGKEPKGPVSVVMFAGDSDDYVPYEGGEQTGLGGYGGIILGIEEAIDYWVRHNQCDPVPVIDYLPQSEEDNRSVRRVIYTGGIRDTYAVLYVIEGGTHSNVWPRGMEITLTGLMWQTLTNPPQPELLDDKVPGEYFRIFIIIGAAASVIVVVTLFYLRYRKRR